MLEEIARAYQPYRGVIKDALTSVAARELPSDCDFLWLTFSAMEYEGLPLKAYPCERNQQRHDGLEGEDAIIDVVPEELTLPDEYFDSFDSCDLFTRALFEYIRGIWLEIGSDRLAYFSESDDGTYFCLTDGRPVSAWDLASDVENHLKG